MIVKKLILSLLFFIFCNVSFTCATNFFDGKFGKGEFVLQGKVEYKQTSMDKIYVSISSYDFYDGKEIDIHPDGTFKAVLPVTDIQDIKLELNNQDVFLFTFPSDTLTLTFDSDDPLNSMTLKGTTPERTRELELGLLLSKKPYYMSFDREIINEQERVKIYTEQFHDDINTILTFIAKNGEIPSAIKFIEDIYYQMLETACNGNLPLALLPYNNPFDMVPDMPAHDSRWGAYDSICSLNMNGKEKIKLLNHHDIKLVQRKRPYEKLDYNTFRYSNKYRLFLDFYHLMDFRYYEVEGGGTVINWIPDVKRYYYSCLAYVEIEPIRDWMITRRLEYDYFSNGEFKDVEAVYLDFKKINKNKEYDKRLYKRYQETLALHASEYAPDFELEDVNGNKVKLSDFRGKIVYIDFWGEYCSPCIAEFKDATPRLKEKYKAADIVYLYICTSTKKENWKKTVEKYNLDGVNLYADGNTSTNEICQKYNVQGIPHYVLINKDGKIEEHRSQRPSEILGNELSKFHKLATQSE